MNEWDWCMAFECWMMMVTHATSCTMSYIRVSFLCCVYVRDVANGFFGLFTHKHGTSRHVGYLWFFGIVTKGYVSRWPRYVSLALFRTGRSNQKLPSIWQLASKRGGRPWEERSNLDEMRWENEIERALLCVYRLQSGTPFLQVSERTKEFSVGIETYRATLLFRNCERGPFQVLDSIFLKMIQEHYSSTVVAYRLRDTIIISVKKIYFINHSLLSKYKIQIQLDGSGWRFD